MDIYVYYRVPPANAPILQPHVQMMQQSLAQHHHIRCSLKRRPELSEGHQTWMEVYQQVPEYFSDALAEAVASHDLMTLIAGARHVETFVDLEACA